MCIRHFVQLFFRQLPGEPTADIIIYNFAVINGHFFIARFRKTGVSDTVDGAWPWLHYSETGVLSPSTAYRLHTDRPHNGWCSQLPSRLFCLPPRGVSHLISLPHNPPDSKIVNNNNNCLFTNPNRKVKRR